MIIKKLALNGIDILYTAIWNEVCNLEVSV